MCGSAVPLVIIGAIIAFPHVHVIVLMYFREPPITCRGEFKKPPGNCKPVP